MAREGYYFHERVGGSGDQGIDVRLRNHHGLSVVVQAKRYDPSGTVPSYHVRDFSGAMGIDRAASYGFFVTTARLTPDGLSVANRSHKHMYVIDGSRLDMELKLRHREIAQCLYEMYHGG